jgi:hypothetical protein
VGVRDFWVGCGVFRCYDVGFPPLQPDKIAPLVDVAIHAVLSSVCEPATPLLILEVRLVLEVKHQILLASVVMPPVARLQDALELQTIHQCGSIWEIMERRRDVFMKVRLACACGKVVGIDTPCWG